MYICGSASCIFSSSIFALWLWSAGVLLSIVVKPGAVRPGFLLVLDAVKLKELARAEVDTVFPLTLHGMYKPRSSDWTVSCPLGQVLCVTLKVWKQVLQQIFSWTWCISLSCSLILIIDWLLLCWEKQCMYAGKQKQSALKIYILFHNQTYFWNHISEKHHNIQCAFSLITSVL